MGLHNPNNLVVAEMFLGHKKKIVNQFIVV
jgi:hypothetical protein